ANPQAAANFLWLPLQRQVNVVGRVERITKAESLKYFLSRPFGSQLGAWVSPQSQVITSRSILEVKLDQMKRKFAEGKVPLPDHWGGYRIVPESFEFWQGRPNRLHDRFIYRLSAAGGWAAERLAP
ncbi:MAG: pyridoxamine 5'-phosphate oxidase, partial [Puniceicoccaceae bacterium]